MTELTANTIEEGEVKSTIFVKEDKNEDVAFQNLSNINLLFLILSFFCF